MRTNPTQKQMVLNHLQKKSLTSWEAIERYGITRLAAVIAELKDSHEILAVREHGNGKRWARYHLIKNKKGN